MSAEENWQTPVSDPLASAQSPWLEGKVALVAGGGLSGPLGGVGFALAWLYARNGAAIAVVDRDAAAAARTVEAIRSAAPGCSPSSRPPKTSGTSRWTST